MRLRFYPSPLGEPGGVLVEGVQDCLHDAIEFSIHLVIPKAKDAITGALQVLISGSIESNLLRERVLPAIDFDD
jgi:hypothetical protein